MFSVGNEDNLKKYKEERFIVLLLKDYMFFQEVNIIVYENGVIMYVNILNFVFFI